MKVTNLLYLNTESCPTLQCLKHYSFTEETIMAHSCMHLLEAYQLTCLFLLKPDTRNCAHERRMPWVFFLIYTHKVVSSQCGWRSSPPAPCPNQGQLPGCSMAVGLAQSFVHWSSGTSLKMNIQQPLWRFYVTGNLPWCLTTLKKSFFFYLIVRVPHGPGGPWSQAARGSLVSIRAEPGSQGLCRCPSRNRTARGHQRSPSPRAPPCGQGQAEARLGHWPMGEGQDQVWWGKLGLDTALEWPGRAVGMGWGQAMRSAHRYGSQFGPRGYLVEHRTRTAAKKLQSSWDGSWIVRSCSKTISQALTEAFKQSCLGGPCTWTCSSFFHNSSSQWAGFEPP